MSNTFGRTRAKVESVFSISLACTPFALFCSFQSLNLCEFFSYDKKSILSGPITNYTNVIRKRKTNVQHATIRYQSFVGKGTR